MLAECETITEIEPEASPEAEALLRNVVSQFQQIVTSSPTLSDDLQTIAINIEEPGRLADFIASSLPFLTTTDKQELLETPDISARLERINKHLAKELEVQQLRNKIQTEVQDSVQSSQRDYYLREQLKAIQKELGDVDDTQKDIAELKEKIENAGMPEEVKKDSLKELGRLSRMNPMAADYGLTRNYVEWLAVLPWAKSSAGEVDILKDGRLDFPDDILRRLDYVVASVHNAMSQDEDAMTDRVIRAMENEYGTMLGHATGRLLLQREPYKINLEKIIDCAARTGTWIELNCSNMRMDMDWRWWHRARDKGV